MGRRFLKFAEAIGYSVEWVVILFINIFYILISVIEKVLNIFSIIPIDKIFMGCWLAGHKDLIEIMPDGEIVRQCSFCRRKVRGLKKITYEPIPRIEQ